MVLILDGLITFTTIGYFESPPFFVLQYYYVERTELALISSVLEFMHACLSLESTSPVTIAKHRKGYDLIAVLE